MRQLPFSKALTLLNTYSIPYAPFTLIKSERDLELLDYPIVLKVYDDKIIHKSDVGGVATNLQDFQQAKKAYDKMKKLTNKILAQRQVKGIELIIGMKRDEQFGPVLMFGMGGIYVEVFKDAALRICPVDKAEARAMIEETKAATLLKGVRGQAKIGIEPLATLLTNISRLALNEDLKELDLNPVIVNKQGIHIVDQRLIR